MSLFVFAYVCGVRMWMWAARAQLLMSDRMIEILGSVPGVELVLHYSGDPAAANAWLTPKQRRFPRLRWTQQVDGDLGERMASAVHGGFVDGCGTVVIVGSDIPAVSAGDITTALQMLHGDTAAPSIGAPTTATTAATERSPTAGHPTQFEMVLGPAHDGGYYAVGVTMAHRAGPRPLAEYRRLFSADAISWGTESVRAQQLAQAKVIGVSASVLPTGHSDVDEPADLPELERVLGVSSATLRHPTLSVVIPTLNEVANIRGVIRRVLAAASTMLDDDAPSAGVLEVIVSDGGSTDGTCDAVECMASELAAAAPAGPVIRLIKGPRGRGRQLNLGATAARGTMLIFLHADTILPDRFDATVCDALWTPGVALGAFAFALDCNQAVVAPHESAAATPPLPPDGFVFSATMRVLEVTTNVRSAYLHIPYGDQAFFIRRDVFWQHDGFNVEFPMMEDLDFVQRVKQAGLGRVMIAAGEPAITSARRWRNHPLGLLGVTGVNQLALIAFNVFGMSPITIAAWYRTLV